MSTAIVWFRRDLRLADNPALAAACARHATVVPLFVFAPGEEGDWAPGAAQRWWLHHSLGAHAEALEALGARLIVRRGPTRTVLAELLDETGAEAVYWNRLHEPAPVERDRALKEWLRAERGVTAESFNAALLFEPWTITTGQDRPYRVFTPFWRRLRREGLPDAVEPTPARVPGPAHGIASEPIAALDLRPAIPWDEGLAAAWTPGEHGAHERLARFLHGALAAYPEQRDLPAVDGTSGLSPHLHLGEIGPRQLVAAVRARSSTDAGADAFLAEVGWREFAHHVLFHHPHTPASALDSRFDDFPWRDPRGEAAADLQAWQRGRTGVPLVDAGMRQLWHSGWMHNRVRMVVASFLAKNLRLHWLEGARWFWDTLVDADLASNTLGWQWAAGCGADAAPYFRVFNPVRQGERFDPEARYVRTWVPEVAGLPDRYVHAPWQAPAAVREEAGARLADYPPPVADPAASRRAALDAFEAIRGRAR